MTEFKIKSLGNGQYVTLADATSKPGVKYRVGCDSLNFKDRTVFITTLVGTYPGKSGAFILYQKEKLSRIDNMQKRLWREVEKAINFAVQLRDEFNIDIQSVDFDLNPNEKYQSSRLVPGAIGYAESLGFKACCKPDELAAIYAADRITHISSEYSVRKGIVT